MYRHSSDTGISRMEDLISDSRGRLIPSQATQFPGSFAPDLRRDSRKYVKSTRWERVLFQYLTDGWDDINIWKSAFIEFVGETALCYLSGMVDTVIGNFHTTQPAAYVGVTNIFLISLFIFAMAPSSGGHVNPVITFATMTAGLTGFSRGILYLVAQTAGAATAGALIRGSFGGKLATAYQGGGCLLDTKVLEVGQAYLIESMTTFIMLFLAFGVGLDPRCGQMFGPKMGPLLVGCVLGLTAFSTVGIAEGFPGANMNPARCFAFAVARKDFEHQWVWWVGPITGTMAQTIVYHIAPPYHREKALERAASKVQGSPGKV
ncbi:aquaporin-like protein [Cadophora sp. DSE1049]|nr:aquaporin-like protein [Cadophora sp. DSE1049]